MKKTECDDDVKVSPYIIDKLRNIIKNVFLEQDGNPIIFQILISALYTKPNAVEPFAKDYYTKQTRIQLVDQEDIISDIARLEDRMSEEEWWVVSG